MLILSDTQIERFWSKIQKTDDNSCWLWQAGLSHGYGTITFNHRQFTAHRIVYALSNGIVDLDSFPDDIVMHACDNKQCNAPHHLSLGTHLANALDREAKGRGALQVGEANHAHKLTVAKVRAIRSLRAADPKTHTYAVLADMYHVAERTIGAVINRKLWSNV